MQNNYSFLGMLCKWIMLTIRMFVRMAARLGPIAEAWDRALTPTDKLTSHQLKRAKYEIIEEENNSN